jgi:hypothetical protein
MTVISKQAAIFGESPRLFDGYIDPSSVIVVPLY